MDGTEAAAEQQPEPSPSDDDGQVVDLTGLDTHPAGRDARQGFPRQSPHEPWGLECISWTQAAHLTAHAAGRSTAHAVRELLL